jgi:hypothetical protein
MYANMKSEFLYKQISMFVAEYPSTENRRKHPVICKTVAWRWQNVINNRSLLVSNTEAEYDGKLILSIIIPFLLYFKRNGLAGSITYTPPLRACYRLAYPWIQIYALRKNSKFLSFRNSRTTK